MAITLLLFFYKGSTVTGKFRQVGTFRAPEQNSLGQTLCELLYRGKAAEELIIRDYQNIHLEPHKCLSSSIILTEKCTIL